MADAKETYAGIVCALLTAVISCGCLTSAPPQPKSWVVTAPRRQIAEMDASKTARLGTVVVSAPYDRSALAVRRADGSIAFDAFNVFASSPSSMLKLPLASVLADAGRFGYVLPSASAVRTGVTIEAVVNDLSLDCREEGRRVARISLTLVVLENRAVVELLDGMGEADAASGDYSAAFSVAFRKAAEAALSSSAKPRQIN